MLCYLDLSIFIRVKLGCIIELMRIPAAPTVLRYIFLFFLLYPKVILGRRHLLTIWVSCGFGCPFALPVLLAVAVLSCAWSDECLGVKEVREWKVSFNLQMGVLGLGCFKVFFLQGVVQFLLLFGRLVDWVSIFSNVFDNEAVLCNLLVVQLLGYLLQEDKLLPLVFNEILVILLAWAHLEHLDVLSP